MTLLSIGNLYIGWDTESFTDVLVHIGKLRVECGGPRDPHGSTQTNTYGPTDPQGTSGHQPSSPVGS